LSWLRREPIPGRIYRLSTSIDRSRQTQAEIDAIRAEVDEYEQHNPDGMPAFIVEVAFFGDE